MSNVRELADGGAEANVGRKSMPWPLWASILALLLIAAIVRFPGISGRSIWYDESISLLIAAGNAYPAWPEEPTAAVEVQELFDGSVGLGEVVSQVRQTDVHPPLYYYALSRWRSIFGPSIEAARWLSFGASLLAVWCFFLLVRRAQFPNPWLLSLVFVFSTAAVHSGHEARSYGLASCLLMFATYMAWLASTSDNNRRAWCFAIISSAAGAFVVHLQYLTLFPVAALVIWLGFRLWSKSQAMAAVVLGVSALIGVLALPTLKHQLGSRPNQFSGAQDPIFSAVRFLELNAEVMGIPLAERTEITYFAAVALFFGAIGLSLRGRSKSQQPKPEIWGLVLMLVLVPTLGLWGLGLVFQKNLLVSRYLTFAGPPLAILLGSGVLRLQQRPAWRTAGWAMFFGLLTLQTSNLNWGFFEVCPNRQFGSYSRSLSSRIVETSRPLHVVAISKGAERGDPGALIYELAPSSSVVVFDDATNLDHFLDAVSPFDDVWLIFSADGSTLEVENRLLKKLEETGKYGGVYRDPTALHLARL